MKFIVSSTTLVKHLQSIGGVIKSKNTLPILDNFLFELKKNQLIVSASDLETSVITKIDVEATEEGSIAIPSKLIIDVLKTFPELPLTFSMEKESSEVIITSDEGKYKLPGFNADEFPQFPEVGNPSFFDIDSTSLFNAITKTIFATSTDEMRPVMTGVFFQISSENATFVATDAHKLVKYERTDISAGEESSSFIVPPKPLHLLKNLIPQDEVNVRVEYNKTNVLFSFGNIKLISKLIEGKYPNYDAVIPAENPHILTIDRAQLLNAIKRIVNFANKATYQVKLNITGSELTISAQDIDAATEAKERLTCNYVGDDMSIGFNAKFLSDMLSNIHDERINIKLSEPGKAGLIVPTEPENPSEDLLMLIMPVMV